MEEVIVSARKRDENLQQVPTAINVITAESLQDRQVSNITDLERISPNITMTETGGSQAGSLQVFMRGIGNDNGFDPGVGLYIDDVFIQRTSGAMLDLYDVERIEVLKGPQGNLYGRNTIGGAIKYITKEPDETLAAQIEGKIGSYNLRQVKASVSGPLIDGLLYGGVGAMTKQRDAIQKNTFNGDKLWDADVQGFRGNLKFTPQDNLTVKAGADYTHDSSAPRIPKLVGANEAALNAIYEGAKGFGSLPANAPPPDFSAAHTSADKVSSEVDFSDYRIYTFTGYLSLQYDLSDQWSFKSVTAERKVTQTFQGEFDGSGITYLANTQQFHSDDLSQELQANFTGEVLDAVAGFFYTSGRADTPSVGTISPYAIYIDRYTNTYKSSADLKSWSLYGNMDYAFADAWHLSLGARLTNDKKTFVNLSDVLYSANGDPNAPGIPASGPVNFGPESTSWRNFSPSAKLAYDFSQDTMGYMSFSTGFKAGGYNPFPNGSPSVTFDPEKVKTYALGLKTTLLDGRLRFNTEAFYNDYTDKQLQYLYVNDGTLTTFYTNAGKVTTQGIETEISWLTPIEGLQF
ncbi:MAG TPA: TonB-dependent receptor, partial [Spongiibacteraceae bacterium]|nr:TonB-dependent receptor [Spongiibacteraceae bacterium]